MMTYTLICPFINSYIGLYALCTFDDYKWGATQKVQAEVVEVREKKTVDVCLQVPSVGHDTPSEALVNFTNVTFDNSFDGYRVPNVTPSDLSMASNVPNVTIQCEISENV